jgi:hypothetical protein
MIYGYALRGPQAASGPRFVEAHAQAAEFVLPPGEYRLKHLPNLMVATRSRLGATTSRAGNRSASLCSDSINGAESALERWLQLRGRSWSRFLPCATRTELNTIAERGPY